MPALQSQGNGAAYPAALTFFTTVATPTPQLDGLTSYTLLQWVKPQVLVESGGAGTGYQWSPVTKYDDLYGPRWNTGVGSFTPIFPGTNYPATIEGSMVGFMTNYELIASSNSVPNNAWQFVATVLDGAGPVIRHYRGSLTVPPALLGTAYDSGVGAGFQEDDTGFPAIGITYGNPPVGTAPAAGVVAVMPSVLTVAQMRAWAYHPRYLPGMVAMWRWGDTGIGNQPDRTGRGATMVNSGRFATPGHPIPAGPLPAIFTAGPALPYTARAAVGA